MDFQWLADNQKGGPADALAQLLWNAAAAMPISTLMPEADALLLWQQGYTSWLQSEAPLQAFEAWAERHLAQWQQDHRQLRGVLPHAVQSAIQSLAERPHTPQKHVVWALIDRPEIRDLVREGVVSLLTEFGKKIRAPVSGVAKGLGGLARAAAEAARVGTGPLGSIVGVVGSEFEKQFERRVQEFADSAVGMVLQRFAETISDPRHAHDATRVRSAVWQGALSVTVSQWAKEAINASPADAVSSLRTSMLPWLLGPEGQTQASAWVRAWYAAHGQKPLRDVLSQFGIEAQTQALCTFVARQLIAAVAPSAAFASF